MRFGRPKVPVFTDPNHEFKIGKGVKMTEGNDVTIVATGHLVWEALEASKVLFEQGISAEVINIHTIKPLDEEIILKSVSKTGCIVSASGLLVVAKNDAAMVHLSNQFANKTSKREYLSLVWGK